MEEKIRVVQQKKIRGKNPVTSISIPRSFVKEMELCAGEQVAISKLSRNKIIISKIEAQTQETG